MRKVIVLLTLLICSSCLSVRAEENFFNTIDQYRARGSRVSFVLPIFSQLVMASLPAGFRPVHEKTTDGKFYIHELVLAGETVEKWSQMVTITGAMGIAANPNLSPQAFLGQMAGLVKRNCPYTFSAKAVSPTKISGHDAFIALAGCGTSQFRGQAHSEVVLLIAIKGSSDYYTIQWAERASPVDRPIDLSDSKWQERLRMLTPIKICPRVPGETAPFPSCVNQDVQKG